MVLMITHRKREREYLELEVSLDGIAAFDLWTTKNNLKKCFKNTLESNLTSSQSVSFCKLEIR
jgi:hypothetical protein